MLTSPGGRCPNMLGYTTNSGYWHLVRKAVAPAFSPRNIRAEFGHVLALAEQMCEIMRGAGPDAFVDVDQLFQVRRGRGGAAAPAPAHARNGCLCPVVQQTS